MSSFGLEEFPRLEHDIVQDHVLRQPSHEADHVRHIFRLEEFFMRHRTVAPETFGAGGTGADDADFHVGLFGLHGKPA